MKKIMLLTFVSAILATSVFANDGQGQPAGKLLQHVKASDVKKAFTNVNFYGSNALNSTVYITAYNTSTFQSYPLTIYSTYPSVNTNFISIPTGNYTVTVSLSESAGIYINGDVNGTYDDWTCDTYYDTFYDVLINDQYAQVVDVTYSCHI